MRYIIILILFLLISCEPEIVDEKIVILSEQGRYEEIIKYCDMKIAFDSTDAYLYHSRGRAYSKLENYENAMIDLDKAIQLVDDNVEYYCSRSFVNIRMGNYEKAISDIDVGKKLDFNNFCIHLNSSLVHLRLEDYEQTILDANKAIIADDENKSSLAKAYLNLATASQKLGLKMEARKAINEAYRMIPNDRDVLRGKSYIEMVERDRVNFFSTIDKARNLYPADAELLYYEGVGTFAFRDSMKGCEIMRKALEKNDSKGSIEWEKNKVHYKKFCIDKNY